MKYQIAIFQGNDKFKIPYNVNIGADTFFISITIQTQYMYI